MLAQHITTIERFYEIYSHSLSVGVLSLQDWLVLNEVQALPSLTEEAQSMLKRLLHSLRTGRIHAQLQGA
ncbi:MAG TPA: hypothetical protein V6D20_03390 [Candidatus Obscuribacterales bacterium]